MKVVGQSRNKKEGFIFRLRDNGEMFEPLEYLHENNAEDSKEHMGITLITKLASDVSYSRAIGLNNLIITVNNICPETGRSRMTGGFNVLFSAIGGVVGVICGLVIGRFSIYYSLYQANTMEDEGNPEYNPEKKAVMGGLVIFGSQKS